MCKKTPTLNTLVLHTRSLPESIYLLGEVPGRTTSLLALSNPVGDIGGGVFLGVLHTPRAGLVHEVVPIIGPLLLQNIGMGLDPYKYLDNNHVLFCTFFFWGGGP